MIRAIALIASFFLAAGGIAGAALANTIGPNSFEVLSYQGLDYKFILIPPGATNVNIRVSADNDIIGAYTGAGSR